jgi:hypothetical protein
LLWRKAEQALAGVYDHTTLQDLVDQDRLARTGFAQSYSI